MHIAQKVDIFDFENDCYMQIDIHINRDNRYCKTGCTYIELLFISLLTQLATQNKSWVNIIYFEKELTLGNSHGLN